jgi:hypothetical protein
MMFPENEIQTYRFSLRGEHYMIDCENGIHVVWTADSSLMPTCESSEWHLETEDSVDYWIAVAYGYKMTDDTTLSCYDEEDYIVIGKVCHRLQQVPCFEEIECIIGYGAQVGSSNFVDWPKRADAWLRRQTIYSYTNSELAEGAD